MSKGMKIMGHIKKQQSQMTDAGLVGQITVDFLTANNPGAIEGMPTLQATGAVEITIKSAQEGLPFEE